MQTIGLLCGPVSIEERNKSKAQGRLSKVYSAYERQRGQLVDACLESISHSPYVVRDRLVVLHEISR